MKIYTKKDKIIIEIPKYQDATDYIGQKVGTIDNIMGVAWQDEYKNQKLGFSFLSDRTYKGAGPDMGVPFFNSFLEKKEFIKLCEKLGIGFYEYPRCAYCGEDLLGSFTIGRKGNMCYECEKKYKL